jgi:DNA-binding NarL/FixJ family response regulator
MKKHPRILIADDHIIVSQGLQSLLEDEFDIVACVTDGRALIETTRRLKPDVVVADISMPVLNGLDAVRYMRRDGDQTKVVFLTMHAEAAIAVEAFRTGATGYVLKQSAGDELIAAIYASLEDRTYLTPLVAQDVLQLLVGSRHRLEQQAARCAPHKCRILQMLSEGRTPNEMAGTLNLMVSTVEAHKDEMMQTFGVQTTTELVRLAMQMGLVTVDSIELDRSTII